MVKPKPTARIHGIAPNPKMGLLITLEHHAPFGVNMAEIE